MKCHFDLHRLRPHIAASAAGNFAAFCASDVLFSAGSFLVAAKWTTYSASTIAALFGGFTAASVAKGSPFRSAAFCGILIGITYFGIWQADGCFLVAGLESHYNSVAFFAILVSVPFALLGAYIERIATRRCVRFREWTYTTTSGDKFRVSDPPRYPALAWFWTGVAIIFLCTIWLPFDYVTPLSNSLAWGLLILVAFRQRQRRMATPVDKLLSRDDRPICIYLRSFRDDGHRMDRATWWRELFSWFHELLGDTREQRLARVVRKFGPFVAIGRPGEELPELGAVRCYVDDEHWQLLVADLISKANLVMLQGGETPGLRWELQTFTAEIMPQNALIFLPLRLTHKQADRDQTYNAFHAWGHELLPRGLPVRIPDNCFFLYFANDPAWEVKTVQSESVVMDDHPLKPMLQLLANDYIIRMPPTRWQTGKAVTCVLVGLALAWTLMLNASSLFSDNTKANEQNDARERPSSSNLNGQSNTAAP